MLLGWLCNRILWNFTLKIVEIASNRLDWLGMIVHVLGLGILLGCRVWLLLRRILPVLIFITLKILSHLWLAVLYYRLLRHSWLIHLTICGVWISSSWLVRRDVVRYLHLITWILLVHIHFRPFFRHTFRLIKIFLKISLKFSIIIWEILFIFKVLVSVIVSFRILLELTVVSTIIDLEISIILSLVLWLILYTVN